MTPFQIREAIQSIVSPHNSSPQLKSSVLDEMAFEALCEMCLIAKPPALRTSNTQNIVADQAEYRMPSNLFMPLSIRVSADSNWTPLRKITQEQLSDLQPDWNTDDVSSGAPMYYYESGVHTTADSDYGKRKISLWPIPTTAVTNGLIAHYLRRPTRFSALTDENTEIVDIDQAHHFGLVYRVVYKLLLRQGTKLGKGVLDNYDALWKQAVFNLKAHHSEAWLDDFKPSVGVFRGIGLDDPRRRY